MEFQKVVHEKWLDRLRKRQLTQANLTAAAAQRTAENLSQVLENNLIVLVARGTGLYCEVSSRHPRPGPFRLLCIFTVALL